MYKVHIPKIVREKDELKKSEKVFHFLFGFISCMVLGTIIGITFFIFILNSEKKEDTFSEHQIVSSFVRNFTSVIFGSTIS